MSTKRGRPKKENARNVEFKLKLTEKEMEELELYSYFSDMSKAEILRRGMRLYMCMFEN